MKKEQNYEIEAEEEYDLEVEERKTGSWKGKIGAIVRLTLMALPFGLFAQALFRDLARLGFDWGTFFGGLIGIFAVPSLFWILVKVICLLTPIVKKVWGWTIALSAFGLFIKIAISIAIFAIPAQAIATLLSLVLEYALDTSSVLLVLVMVLLSLLSIFFVFVDICKLMGRSAIETIKNLVSKKTA